MRCPAVVRCRLTPAAGPWQGLAWRAVCSAVALLAGSVR